MFQVAGIYPSARDFDEFENVKRQSIILIN